MVRTTTTRSNYFQVENREAFEMWLKNFHYYSEPEVWDGPKGSNTIAFGMFDHIPDSRSEDAELQDDEFLHELALHLTPNQVVIIHSVSAGKLRYASGMAAAVHSDGRILQLNMGDQLDELVEKEWGATPTPAQY